MAAPYIGDQCSPAAWEDFIREWHAYTHTSNITDDIASAYFLHCLEDGVRTTLYRQSKDPNKMPIADLITSARAVSVLHIPTGQRRFEALKMRQADGEKFTQFYTRLRGAALDCNFSVVEPTTKVPVDFTPNILSMILLQGLADEEIRRDILKKKDIDSWEPQRIVTEVELRSKASERARATGAQTSPAVGAAVSSHKRSSNGQRPNSSGSASAPPRSAADPLPSIKKLMCACSAKFDNFFKSKRS